MDPLITLDDARSRDPRVAGAKAAGLSRARAAGLPVLPGWVIPVEAASAGLRGGNEALGRSGHAAAILAMAGTPLGEDVDRVLGRVSGALGGPAIVRSSTGFDADPRWAGAFATYTDVGAEDLATAIRGCWGSVFSRDVLGRCEAMAVGPDAIGMAVLIQPWVAFDAVGTAVVLDHGRVRVTAGGGAPAGLAAGRSDATVIDVGLELRRTSPDGERPTAGSREDFSRAAAELAHSALRETGEAAIEWGRSAGRLVLLQVRKAPVVSSARARGSARRPERSFPPVAERMAELAIAFPGPLADRWVLPWALGVDPSPGTPEIEIRDLPAAVAAAREVAGELTARAWGSATADASREAAAVFRSVLGTAPDAGLDRLARLRPVDPASGARLLGIVAGIGRALERRGALGVADSIWRLTPDEVERLAASTDRRPPGRLGPDRWEPFVFSVVAANGRVLHGAPAAPGAGAGRLRVLHGPDPMWRPGPREALALIDASPQAAPFLWNAAGLVTARGSAGAHLFEVARSLGVPAVVGVAPPTAADGELVAVDGDAGSVSILERRLRSSGRVGA